MKKAILLSAVGLAVAAGIVYQRYFAWKPVN